MAGLPSIATPPQRNPPLMLTADSGDWEAGALDNDRLFSKEYWLWMQRMTAAVNFLLGQVTPPPPVVAGSVLAVDETVTADTVITGPAVVHGDFLVVRVAQDGVGGHNVTFGSTFKFAPPLASLSKAADTASLMCFVGSSTGFWVACAQPILERHANAASVTPGTSGVVKSIDQTITAPATITGPTVVPGDVLLVRVLEDGTGGHAVTFDSSFLYAPTIPTTANTASLALFFGSQTGKWECCAVPILGRAGSPATTTLSGDAVLSQEYAITADTTISPPTLIAGNLLVILVQQDATGGWVVTMGAGFSGAPALSAVANTVTVMTFFGATSGVWELCAASIFERSL